MPDDIELNSVDLITIGTIGPPGRRVFHLQARTPDRLLTLTIEKVQAAAIADSIEELLSQLQQELSIETDDPAGAVDLDLVEPIQPLFRVGQIGLGYDRDADRIVLITTELLPEDSLDRPRIVRITAAREQMRALIEHTRQVVAAGRPICGNCGQPIDPEGHFCPRSNGHRKPVDWA